jgi:hypothetical protein
MQPEIAHPVVLFERPDQLLNRFQAVVKSIETLLGRFTLAGSHQLDLLPCGFGSGRAEIGSRLVPNIATQSI